MRDVACSECSVWRHPTALALAAVLATASCSFVMVQGPPPRDDKAPRPLFDSECTRSKVAPVLDTILAASAGGMLAGTLLASMIGTPPANQTPEERQASLREARVLEIGALVAGVAPTASAIWGFHTVRKCREYEEDP